MEIYKKIAAVKSEIGTLSKNAKNPFFKSDYLDLNGILSAVEPLLQKHGLLLMQPIQNNMVCSTIADIESGEHQTSAIELPPITDPQKLGSCITYFRRYTLQSLLSLQAVDDDGNGASKATRTLPASQFQKGADQVATGALSISEFENKLSKFDLTEVQSKSLVLLKSTLV